MIAAPLERRKQKEIAFHWDDDCDAAFYQPQRSLVHPPIQINPDFTKWFKFYEDSSHLAMGACLMQGVDGRDRAVAYASKLPVGSQLNWINRTDGTTEIEGWSVVGSTSKFRCYLDHAEFGMFSDHQALTWIFGENAHDEREAGTLGHGSIPAAFQGSPSRLSTHGPCGRPVESSPATRRRGRDDE
ncbi:hypothetical protein ON010_g15565 [Phytophthora cinnamomi]|nr:hypothetical protein ON010_g15565 [Phytophthora cinnamomi]